jgi:hypothetical protein
MISNHQDIIENNHTQQKKSIAFDLIKDIISFLLDMFSYIGIVLINLLQSTVTTHRDMA